MNPSSNQPDDLRAAGEDLGYSLTPASVDTQPTPQDLLESALSYAQAVIGSGVKIQSFKQTSTNPVIWQAEVLQGQRVVLLNAKKVVGGYKFSVG